MMLQWDWVGRSKANHRNFGKTFPPLAEANQGIRGGSEDDPTPRCGVVFTPPPRALKMRKSVFMRKLLMRLVFTRTRDLRARWCVSSRLVSCKSNLAGNRARIQSEVKWNAWQVSLKFLHTASARTSDWTHHPPISLNFFRKLHAYFKLEILR